MPAKAATESLGAQLAMRRRTHRKTCASRECKNKFEGLAITHYCSEECRFREAYLRRKDREAEPV